MYLHLRSKTANDRCRYSFSRPHSTYSFADTLPAFSIPQSVSCLELIPAVVLKVRRTLESRTDEDSANRDFKIFIFVLLNFAALQQCTVKRSIYSRKVGGMLSRPVSGNRFAQIFSFKLILKIAQEMKVALRYKLLTMLTGVSILVIISQISHNIVIMQLDCSQNAF